MSGTPKILLITNQQNTMPLVHVGFLPQRWQLVIELHPSNALQRWSEETPDIILFDVDGNGTSGLDLIWRLREQSVIPILWLSSNLTERFIVEAYEAGVDDYVMKPVLPSVLQAKIKAWLRRSSSVPVDMLDSLNVGNVHFIPSDRTIVLNGSGPIRLTNLEMRVMFYLMSHMNRTVTTEELCQRAWGTQAEGNKTALKNVVYRLRQKIEADPDQPQYIKTVPGLGYQFKVK